MPGIDSDSERTLTVDMGFREKQRLTSVLGDGIEVLVG
jgi:hypothetical protein